MRLIGITGSKGAGKNMAAAALCLEGYKQFHFADLLKNMLRNLLIAQNVNPRTVERMIDGDLKEMPCDQLCGKSARWAMQTLGSEWGRNLIGENIWVTATMTAAKEFSHVVISDVRFPNEAQAVREAGGKIVVIVRDGCNGDSHSSENRTFSEDYAIVNNGTIEELQGNMTALEKQIYG
jgi:hypothetical protein